MKKHGLLESLEQNLEHPKIVERVNLTLLGEILLHWQIACVLMCCYCVYVVCRYISGELFHIDFASTQPFQIQRKKATAFGAAILNN